MTSVSDFATEKAFKAYKEYLAIKRHFDTESYDYFKYNGAVKVNYDKFATRSDVFYFNKAARLSNMKELFVCNLAIDTKLWIADIIDDVGDATYHEWKGKISSMSYQIERDAANILSENYVENFEARGNDYPLIMEKLIQREISLEVFTVLANKAKVIPYWEKNIKDKFLSKDLIRRAKKYYPFLQIDHQRVNATIKKNFKFD